MRCIPSVECHHERLHILERDAIISNVISPYKRLSIFSFSPLTLLATNRSKEALRYRISHHTSLLRHQHTAASPAKDRGLNILRARVGVTHMDELMRGTGLTRGYKTSNQTNFKVFEIYILLHINKPTFTFTHMYHKLHLED